MFRFTQVVARIRSAAVAREFVAGRRRSSKAQRRTARRFESLERRDLLADTSYVSIDIVNNSQLNSSSVGLADDDIYLFFTQENINTTWSIDPTTGVATSNPAGTPAPSITLADLKEASSNGAILIDASAEVDSARIYLSDSDQAVTCNACTPTGTISGPTASIAMFYYDFVEFALNTQPGILNIDTTQVDQLGIPLTIDVSPADPNFPAGSGVISTLDRTTLIQDYQAMATGDLAPFADSLFPVPGSNPTEYYRLLNPKDVISGQLNATSLTGPITTTGTPGDWTATFTIMGPGMPIPTNGALSAGMHVSGPLIPAGTTISSLPDSPAGSTVVMTSTLTDNPFTASASDVELFFFEFPATQLATYFDQAIDDLFDHYIMHPDTLMIEQNSNGVDVVYTGNVVEIMGINDINGGISNYTVIQFTGNGETYNIYYPFFTTNSPAGKQTPLGDPVPPPPEWWTPTQGLKFFEPPSAMVFGADGVFADNTQQNASAPGSPNAALQGALENVLVTALARGYATTWQYRNGTIAQVPPVDGEFAKTATVNLASGEDTTGLTNDMFMSSFQIANVPMTPMIPDGAPVSSFTVSSPLPIPPTAPDLLTFAEYYPAGGTWSAFANFLHNGAGYEIMIDGRAYALPFDDQGGFSSDLNSATSVEDPAVVTITLGPWSPAPPSVVMDNGDAAPGYTESGELGLPWHNQGFDGDVREIIGSGKSATYTFDGLSPGVMYDVATTWTHFLNRDTSAPYTINGAVGGSVVRQVDQTLPPDDFSADGTDWERLGTFEVAEDGTLTVTISGKGVRSVIADAVRIDPRGDAEIAVSQDGASVFVGGPATDIGNGLTGAVVSKVFTISNVGATRLELSGTLNLPPGFQLGTNNTPSTLFDGSTPTNVDPGEAVSFEVLLDTTAPGTSSGPLSFDTNDADEGTFTINVTGTVLGNVMIIDDGNVGHTDSGNMVTWLQGHQSDVREGIAGGVAESAEYVFPGLPAGTYRISATWTPYYNRATNAPYTINGGAPIPINQKLSPHVAASTPEGTFVHDAGTNYADLDNSFSFAGGTLTVGLSDNGADGNVIFDAVRIELLAAPPIIAGFALPAPTGPAFQPQTNLLPSSALVLPQAPSAALFGPLLASSRTQLVHTNASVRVSMPAHEVDAALVEIDRACSIADELGAALQLNDADSLADMNDELLSKPPRRQFGAPDRELSDTEPLVATANPIIAASLHDSGHRRPRVGGAVTEG